MGKQSDLWNTLDVQALCLEAKAIIVISRLYNMPYANQFYKYRDMELVGQYGKEIQAVRAQQEAIAEQL